jgi:ABC-type bacteriocin/lantibiotic exporter with double-glycine peptidase domain
MRSGDNLSMETFGRPLVGEILNTPWSQPSRPDARPAAKRTIAFEHVSFRYRPDIPVALHDTRLQIPAG